MNSKRDLLFNSIVLTLGFACCLLSETSAQDKVQFNRDIRPILSDNCFSCHGPDEETREADLRLDDEANTKMKRGDYQVVAEGLPNKSELIERIFSDDEDLVMPPPDFDKKLSPKQKKLLKSWIEQGAQWSKHWAYVPPVRHPVPKVESDWPQSWIDNFILHQMKSAGLEPVKDADRIAWIRRVSFDLIGLPPTSDDVKAFLADTAEQAKSKVVERLLASEHFGERMAIYWLDLVRYADTVGYHGDQDHNISPYRDWVINAFNDNMPFDRFTVEQLAGDLVSDSGQSQLIASGYNRLLQTTHEGGLQPKEYRAIYAADRVRNVSAVWMGGTLGCGQCHDHKYDPYTTKDFYSMAAFFADIDDEEHFRSGTNSLPTRRNPELRILTAEQQAEINRLQMAEQDLKKKKEQAAKDKDANADALKQLDAKLKEVANQIRNVENAGRLTMITRSLDKPRETRILPRGNFLDESGAVVQPAVPGFLSELGKIGEGDRRLNRLQLARWLTDSKQPSGLLTARVFVNRMWYLFYGRGLAPDLSDFGGQGLPPNHPELLDNLAIAFVESNWNVKELVKNLVLTRTYQLDSTPTPLMAEKDPENNYFARQSRYRLPAEMIRDNALAVSGLLVTHIGGKSIKPYQPAGYYRHLNFPTRRYQHDQGEQQYQRGIYVHWQRQFLHPMLRAFDAPRREECTAERPTSNTPNAALVLLNDPTFVESARVFASNILKREKEPEARIGLAFELALSRKPDEFELNLLNKLYRTSYTIYAKDAEAAKELLQTGLMPFEQKLDAATLAAFTQVTRALFNLDEFVSRR